MGLAEIKREIESLLRRIRMKKQVMAEATSPEIKRELYTEVRELEQEVQTLEKREKKLNGSPPTVKFLKPRRTWSKSNV